MAMTKLQFCDTKQPKKSGKKSIECKLNFLLFRFISSSPTVSLSCCCPSAEDSKVTLRQIALIA